MHLRILLIFLVIGLRATPQAVVPNNSPQTNSNNTAVPEMKLEENSMDSVFIKNDQEKREESIQQKKQAPATKNKDVARPQQLDIQQNQQIQQTTTLFTTTRQQASTQRTQRTPSPSQQAQMDSYVRLLSEAAPESFEYHYYTYLAGNYNIDLIDHLHKAEEQKPDNSDVQIQLAAYNLITNNLIDARKYLKTLHSSNRINEVMFLYGKDLLRSVPTNGCLITHGFEDTFGAFYAQIIQNERPDVTIISLDFLQSEAYRKTLSSKGYSIPSFQLVDVAYLSEFCIKNELKNISISLTVPKEYLIPLKDDLYVAGLIMEYHSNGCTGLFERNENLWDKELSATILKNGRDKARSLSANYIPMLLLLRKEYQNKAQERELQKIDAIIDQIAVQCGKYEQVQSIKASY